MLLRRLLHLVLARLGGQISVFCVRLVSNLCAPCRFKPTKAVKSLADRCGSSTEVLGYHVGQGFVSGLWWLRVTTLIDVFPLRR